MIEIKSPYEYAGFSRTTIFLAGSIEMGTAENWQSIVAQKLVDFDCVLLNPRRDDWDSTWEQSIDNPQFRKQVEWELDKIDDAHYVVFYFDPNTKSPITLLELGLVAQEKYNIIVCCPDGFWRKGNVDIVCERYHITLVKTLDEMINILKDVLSE